MSEHLYIAAPLDIDGWEVVECLESHTLFEEFAERVDDALSLIREGQSHWREHQTADGEWSATAVDTVAEVRRLAYNIRQSFKSYGGDLAACIRSSISSSGAGISDAQHVAAFAMDRACRVIETVGQWLAAFDAELLTAPAETAPDEFDNMLESLRLECAQSEMETRESAADLFGLARNYMSLADAYASPNVSEEVKEGITRSAIERELPKAVAEQHRQRARLGGLKGGRTKKEQFTQDAAATCRAARRLKASNTSIGDSALVTALVDQGHGTRPTVIARLRTEGVYPPLRSRPKKT